MIADTGPLNYLVLLQKEYLLPELYGQVVIPFAVWHELRHSNAPPEVRRWLSSPPSWLVLAPVQQLDLSLDMRLGAGEFEALSLALEQGTGLLLIDDSEARQAATSRNLQTIGTLGVLIRGANLGYFSLADEVASLLRFGFRAKAELIRSVLAQQTPGPFNP